MATPTGRRGRWSHLPENKPPRDEIPVPHDLQIELHDDPEAAAAFAALPPSHQREYIDWIISARLAETRMRRVEETARRLKQTPD